MGYTNEQIQWVIDNEVYMWQYFVQKQALQYRPFSDPKIYRSSSFFKVLFEIDNESPGRVGLGWVGKSLDPIWIVIQILR